MNAYVLTLDGNITATETVAAAAMPKGYFETQNGLRLLLDEVSPVDIWNSLTGVSPVKRFTSKEIAAQRIWRELQKLAPAPITIEEFATTPEAKANEKTWDKVAKAKKAKPAKKEKAPVPAATNGPREGSKTAQLIDMLKRPNGASLAEIMKAFDWQAHTTRALMSAGGSLTKKHGLKVASEMVGEERRYSL